MKRGCMAGVEDALPANQKSKGSSLPYTPLEEGSPYLATEMQLSAYRRPVPGQGRGVQYYREEQVG